MVATKKPKKSKAAKNYKATNRIKSVDGDKPKAAKTKKPAKPKAPSASVLSAARLTQLKEIEQKEKDVRELEGIHNVARREAKTAKDAFEKADTELRALIARGPDLQLKLPLNGEAKPSDAPAASNTYRLTPVSDLGLQPALTNSLQEHGLNNIGDVQDWTAAHKKLSDVPGIGPEKSIVVSDALSDWFAKHPDHCQQAVSAEIAKEDAAKPETNGHAEANGVPDVIMGAEVKPLKKPKAK